MGSEADTEHHQLTLGYRGYVDGFALVDAIREVMQAHGIGEDEWDIINVE